MRVSGGGASHTTDFATGNSTATGVSLLDHVASWRWDDQRMNEYRDNVERRFRLEMIAALLAFGTFAWREIQRRLESLNHENARILQAQQSSVSADTYSANEQQRKEEQREFKQWKENVDRDRTQSVSRDEFQRDTKQDKRAGISTTQAVISSIVAVVVVTLAVLNYQALHHTQSPAPIVVTVTTRR